MGGGPHVTVVVPVQRDGPFLRQCLEHLQLQTYRAFDVCLVTDAPATLAAGDLSLRIIVSGPLPQNMKRFQAAHATSAPLLAFIDDDAYPHPDWLSTAVRHFDDPSIVAAGGPNLTPPDDDPTRRASGAVYASPLVSAAHVRRYAPRRAGDVATLPSCNLLVRREHFLTAALATLHYYAGEDTLLCARLTADKMRIAYDPTALVYHHRRPLFWEHFRQVWGYAIHRGYFARRFPATRRDLSYFVPLLFLFGHGVAAASAFVRPLRRPTLALAATYAVLVAREAARARRAHDVDPLAVAAGIYLTYLTYGAGVASGLTRRRLEP